MARVETTIQEAAKSLRQSIRDLIVGDVNVRSVELRFDEDASGELALFVDVTLSDPGPGDETWPVRDILELHRTIDERARELDISIPWHVTLQKETPDEPDPEDLEPEDG